MSKTAVFVLGPDRPGIIATVAQVLFEQGCNLEDVSQTCLQEQFVGIFVVAADGRRQGGDLLPALRERLDPLGMTVHAGAVRAAAAPAPAERLVITAVGPDRPGLVAGLAELLARHGANITNLKAVPRGTGGGVEYVIFFEVDLPGGADRQAFRTALRERARELGLDVNLQNREIFEQVHRV